MKSIKFLASLLFFISLSIVTLQAQPGGGGGGGGGGGNSGGNSGSSNNSSNNNSSSSRETTSVLSDADLGGAATDEEELSKSAPTDFVAMAGLFEIDQAVVIKKCGIKDKALAESVSAAILEYQKLSERIEKEFSKDVTLLRKCEIEAKAGSTNMNQVTEVTQTIKKRSVLVHKRLSTSIAGLLSEKELKKWNSLYKKMCEDKGFSI